MLSNRSEVEFTADELGQVISRLDRPDKDTAPLTTMLENSLGVGPGKGRATYRDQKHHWVRWLNDYQRPDRPAQRVYNAINCPTMLLWLGEALGVDRERVVSAIHAAENAPANQISQTAAIRGLIGWDVIHRKLVRLLRAKASGLSGDL
ncbi:MAG: hypothetical protein AAGF25_14535 [Pseudomonadota bacterium]